MIRAVSLGMVLMVLVAASGGERERSADRGEYIFKNRCVFCHDPASEEPRVGPGFGGMVSKKSFFPVSGRRINLRIFKELLREPSGIMPPFGDLTDQELEDVYRYLEGL